MKYQLESMKVSIVSVSRRAGSPVGGEKPVAEAIGDLAAAPALGLDIISNGLVAPVAGEAVEGAGVDHRAGLDVGLGQFLALPARRGADGDAVEAFLLGELEVTLVVGGNAHA